MSNWTARVEWTRVTYNEAEIDDLIDRLAGHSAAIGLEHDPGEFHPKTYSAIITLDASSLRQATTTALQIVEAATREKANGIEVMRTHEFDRRVDEPTFPELVGYAEIAEMAGVSRQRAAQLADAEGFPPAVVRVKSGPLRVRKQVVGWLSRWERKAGRPKSQVEA